MKRFPKLFQDGPALSHGGDYNPDQWMDRYPEVLEEDIRLMDEAGCETFSLGIFAWARYEPREGEYHFDWMRGILDRLHASGKRAVLATPSGSKPAWMSKAFPEVCRVDERGRREHHHHRHNHCFTSPVYRRKVAELNRGLAKAFGDHPAVRMWHLSNEYNGECHCGRCHAAFQRWLQEKYGSLEELNHAWWSHFWSHTFGDWSEIDPRDGSVDGMRLDWLRFVTHQTVDFMRAEIAALREGGAEQPVTTNMMGLFPTIDYWRYLDVVDVVADDSYPSWKHDESDAATAAYTAMVHDMHRSMKGGKPWMLMESCPDTVQWCPVPKRKRPGVYRTEMLQAVAHGADAVMYFQWRKGRGGMEKFHGAVVDHEGSNRTRVFRQVAELGDTLKKLEKVGGTSRFSEVALIFDWEVRWALEASRGPLRVSGEDLYVGPAAEFHRAFWSRGLSTDVVESTVDLTGYRLVVAPQLYMLKPGVAYALKAYVEAGGTLVLTWLSGVVNESNLCFRGGFPGDGLRKFAGVWAEEVDALYPGESQTVKADAGNPLALRGGYATQRVCEVLHAEDAEVLARFDSDFYQGHPALTRKKIGKGSVYYLGARMGDDFLADFVDGLRGELSLSRVIERDLPAAVSAQMRTDGETEYVFLQNFSQEAKLVPLDERELICMEIGQAIGDALELPPWQTRILRRAVRD